MHTHGLQQTLISHHRLQVPTLPLRDTTASARAAWFVIFKGLQLTMSTSDALPTTWRNSSAKTVGHTEDMGHQDCVAPHCRNQVLPLPRIQAMTRTTRVWHALPAQPSLRAMKARAMNQAHVGSLAVADTVRRRANGTPKANQSAFRIVRVKFGNSSKRIRRGLR